MALLRPRRVLTAVAVLALGALLAACGSSAPAAPPPSQGLVVNRPTPQHVGLVDQQGRRVSLAGLRGKVVVLAPFLTLCQDECPLVTAAFLSLRARRAGGGARVPGRLRRGDGRPRARHRGPPGRLPDASSAPTGSCGRARPPTVAAFWKPFGVGYQIVPEEKPAHLDWWTGMPLTYDVVHTDGYILVDPTAASASSMPAHPIWAAGWTRS